MACTDHPRENRFEMANGATWAFDDADALAVETDAEARVEPVSVPLCWTVARIAVYIRLEIEMAAGGAEVIGLDNNARSDAVLDADDQFCTSGGTRSGCGPLTPMRVPTRPP